MRTTIDIDDTVLAAARSLAQARGISLGSAVSELARRGLERPTAPATGSPDLSYSPFPVFVGEPGTVVTDDLIADHRDD